MGNAAAQDNTTEVTQVQDDSSQEQTSPNSQDSTQQVSAAEPALADPAAQQAPTAEEAAAAMAAAFKPNLKFKVANKEHAIDEFLHPAIKDEATNKKLIELYEKAYGLDIVKPQRDEARETAKKWEGEYQGLAQEVQGVMSLRDTDPWQFFKILGVEENKIFQLVKERLQYEQLPQDQRQVIERQRHAEQTARQAEFEKQSAIEFARDQMAQARAVELNFTLERPEVKPFAERFNAVKGAPDAFENAVYEIAMAAESRGEDLTPAQAVQRVMAAYGPFLGSASPGMEQTQVAQPTQAQPVKATQRPPVIPTVNGRNSSPTERAINTLEDLEKYTQEKYGRKA
jgi:hypothetical protein